MLTKLYVTSHINHYLYEACIKHNESFVKKKSPTICNINGKKINVQYNVANQTNAYKQLQDFG